MNHKIKVLIIDDSALVREVLSEGLAVDKGLLVVGTASDAYDARDKIIELKPDVLTLDVGMPRMNGVEFLKKLMPQYPIPVVMVSALTEKGAGITLDALEAGAVDFVTKPKTNAAQGVNGMLTELRVKIKIASTVNLSAWKKKRKLPHKAFSDSEEKLTAISDKIIAIGASTGGTEAIKEVVSNFPLATPGVVIVQHMPEKFTGAFAERLNRFCKMEVSEAKDGDIVSAGRVLIAPGNRHMEVYRSKEIYRARILAGPPVCGHRPSVEVLMNSVAISAGKNSVGVMLTGMGNDGSTAMLNMRNQGARTFAQDQKTSVVFGMPKKAYERGGVEFMLPLSEISVNILSLFKNI